MKWLAILIAVLGVGDACDWGHCEFSYTHYGELESGQEKRINLSGNRVCGHGVQQGVCSERTC